jgi:CheY-like chemotaxis protein
LSGQRSVLIVDRSEETREVLQTVLQRRGVRTLAADRAQKGLELARQHQPDLIVLDMELEDGPVEQAFLPAQWQTGMSASPVISQTGMSAPPVNPQYEPRLVLLGSLRDYRRRLAGGEFVSKPYHYGPLIRKIEELLDDSQDSGTCRRSSSSVGPIRAAVTS